MVEVVLIIRLLIDEGGSGVGLFLSEFGEGTRLQNEEIAQEAASPVLFRLSDATGSITFGRVEAALFSSLHSSDAFLLDDSNNTSNPAIYVWLGGGASLTEKRLSAQYAQRYLYEKQQGGSGGGNVQVAIPIVKMVEGSESREFMRAIGG